MVWQINGLCGKRFRCRYFFLLISHHRTYWISNLQRISFWRTTFAGQLSGKSSFQTGFLYFLYGMTVLLLLFSHNDTAVKSIVHEITQHTLSNLYTTPLFSVFFIGFLCCYFFIHKWKTNVLKKGLKELFFLGLLSLIFRSSSLIWGFAIYFIFWHSIPSLFDQIVFLYGNARREKILSYSKKAFPYWLISVLGILLIHHYFAEDKQFSSSFFCIIAAVTFPHAFIMRKMFRSK